MRWQIQEGNKLGLFLAHRLGVSGKKARNLLEVNQCRVNGKVERFFSARLEMGDVVEISLGWESYLSSREISVSPEIIFETPDWIAVNKPPGFVSSEEKVLERWGKTLWAAHRLDKETSGLWILTKTAQAQEDFFSLFSQRAIEKKYLAVVDGCLREDRGERTSRLVRKKTWQGQTLWGSGPRGLKAITQWEVLARREKETLLSLVPKTGRTHQIRVHMAEMGHPILVDRQYASSFVSSLFAPRYWLHAHELSFSFRGKFYQIQAPLPEDMRKTVDIFN